MDNNPAISSTYGTGRAGHILDQLPIQAVILDGDGEKKCSFVLHGAPNRDLT